MVVLAVHQQMCLVRADGIHIGQWLKITNIDGIQWHIQPNSNGCNKAVDNANLMTKPIGLKLMHRPFRVLLQNMNVEESRQEPSCIVLLLAVSRTLYNFHKGNARNANTRSVQCLIPLLGFRSIP